MKRRPFPCSNRLVEQRLEERHLQQHHAAMKKVKSTLDTRGPPLKRNMNLKKLQMEEDRCLVIDRDNKKLLQRMQEVVTHQQMDCWLVPKKAQSNWLHRKHEQMRIVAQNRLILSRLEKVRPVFDVAKWEDERREMERRIRFMSTYDEDGNIKGLAKARALAQGKAEITLPTGSASSSMLGSSKSAQSLKGKRTPGSGAGGRGRGGKLKPLSKSQSQGGGRRGKPTAVGALLEEAEAENAAVRIQAIAKGRTTRRHMDEIKERKQAEKAEAARAREETGVSASPGKGRKRGKGASPQRGASRAPGEAEADAAAARIQSVARGNRARATGEHHVVDDDDGGPAIDDAEENYSEDEE